MRWRSRKKTTEPVEAEPDVEWIDPSQLLFSLATICDELPAVGDEPAREGDLVLHEDDWRQVELVAAGQRSAIADNLAAIGEIVAERSRIGFTRIHVRVEPREPLLGLRVTRADLARGLGLDEAAATGVAFRSEPRRVIGGFAYDLGGSFVYGVERDGLVTTVGIHPGSAALNEFAGSHDCYVVDWVGGQYYSGTTD